MILSSSRAMILKFCCFFFHPSHISVLSQASLPIFQTALNKLRNFIMEHELETQIAGPLVGVLCRSFVCARSKETLNALVPFLRDRVLEIIDEDEDALKSETPNAQLIYPLLLLERLSLSRGDAMLPHLDSFTLIIDRLLVARNVEVHMLTCDVLANVTLCLTTTQFYGCGVNLDDPRRCWVRDWGITGHALDNKPLAVCPGEREFAAVKKLFHRYCEHGLKPILQFIETGEAPPKHELHGGIRVLVRLFETCTVALPKVEGEPDLIAPYDDKIKPYQPYVGWNRDWVLTMPDGSHAANYLLDVVEKLQKLMLEKMEDDAKGILQMCMV